MRCLLGVVAAFLFCGAAVAQQPDSQALPVPSPTVELEGRISSVHVAPGRGMPYLEVEENGKTAKVYLGSMNYLMQHNFNPKAGEEVKVKGFRRGDDIVAITVTLPSRKRTIRLRSDNGLPLWERGRFGRRYGRGPRRQRGPDQ